MLHSVAAASTNPIGTWKQPDPPGQRILQALDQSTPTRAQVGGPALLASWAATARVQPQQATT